MRAVLTYHAVDRSGSVVAVAPDIFRSHCEWLASGAVRVVGLAELCSLPNDCNAVALTFDDALESVVTEAAPALNAHGLRATVFAVTDHAGGDNCWDGATDPRIPVSAVLNWDALGALAALGWSVGSHTRRHPHLTKCSDDELVDELEGSAEAIQRHIGTRPDTFAYPYGDVDARVAAATAVVYPFACTTEYCSVTPDTDRALIPRLDAWYFREGSAFRDWGSRRFRRSIAWRHALRRVRRMIA